jgi:hypothetical protein
MRLNNRSEYQALKALNYSGAKELLKSPAHYQTWLAEPSKDSPALRVGQAVHAAVLEPMHYAADFAVIPEDIDRRTKEGKEKWAEFQTVHAGKVHLKQDEADLVSAVSAQIITTMHRLSVKPVHREVPLAVSYCGVPIKSCIDIIAEDGYLYDLKTTEDASPKGFQQSVRAYRYNLQAYFYRLVSELAGMGRPLGFRFIVVEKAPPYAVAVYELGPNLTSYAIEDFERAIKLYSDCTASGVWPAYPEEPQVIDIGAPASAASPITFA